MAKDQPDALNAELAAYPPGIGPLAVIFPRKVVAKQNSIHVAYSAHINGINAAVVPVPERPSGRLAWLVSGVDGE